MTASPEALPELDSPIPFMDLRAPYLDQQAAIDKAVHRCLDSGWYVLGQEVAAFESEFAAWLVNQSAGGSEIPPVTCAGVNSGTDALHIALRACEIGPGDEVITVAHTAVATAAAIRLAGAQPVFVDIDPHTYTLDPQALEQAISPRTRAIIPVHLYGQPADLAPILEQARAADLYVIEDCAQAHGATYHGRTAGLWGDLACFSFYPTKNLGALGDGGAVVGHNAALMERVRLVREYGWTPQARYVSQLDGLNSRLDELQAAILRVRLDALAGWNQRRRALATLYAQTLAAHPATAAHIRVPYVGDYHRPGETNAHVYHLYVIRTPHRDALQQALKNAGIGTGIHYPVPVHRQPAYAEYRNVQLPVTEQIAGEILSLPMHPFLTPEQVRRIATTIAESCAGLARG